MWGILKHCGFASLAILAALALLLFAVVPGHVARADSLSVSIPVDVGSSEHWVDINLSQQILVAMNGTQADKVIFVTTGQPGYETPTGTFHFLRRVEDETMRSSALGIPIDSPDGWDLEHVMYTQYFTNQGHALHDNYWRPDNVFGSQATSHGCAGMRLEDAKYLWGFLGNGSRVVIHY
ncbi:MAG: L,D-transpeptidase [Dehalococcoidia bacterium]